MAPPLLAHSICLPLPSDAASAVVQAPLYRQGTARPALTGLPTRSCRPCGTATASPTFRSLSRWAGPWVRCRQRGPRSVVALPQDGCTRDIPFCLPCTSSWRTILANALAGRAAGSRCRLPSAPASPTRLQPRCQPHPHPPIHPHLHTPNRRTLAPRGAEATLTPLASSGTSSRQGGDPI